MAVLLVLGVLALIGRNHEEPAPPQIGVGCLVKGKGFDVPLSTSQAGIAATIAGVADQRAMPVRAVTIAYATALQESDLENLPYGDRDSVGIFQQRPSQGWGTKTELLNPIYATTRFFAALAAVPGYRSFRSTGPPRTCSAAPTGTPTASIPVRARPWRRGSPAGGPGDLVLVRRGHQGPRQVRPRRPGPDYRVRAASGQPLRRPGHGRQSRQPRRRLGGRVWLVTHAGSYGIKTVRFCGYQWAAAQGQDGWVKARPSRRWPSAKLTVAFG